MPSLPPPFATAFWTIAPGQGSLRTEPLPQLGPDMALIQVLNSGISRGTETLVFNGQVPLSQREAMRCPHQQGEFPGPVKYGYCSVGRVYDGPPEWKGQRVFCLHPHQDWYCVETNGLVAVPDGVSSARAVLAANMETALNGIWDSDVRMGDRVAVVGAGVVGSLVAALAARIPGTSVELIDIDESRQAVASALGCQFATPSSAQANADVVIHASGRSDGLTTSLSLAGFESTVLELSWFGAQLVTVPLGEAFHSRRLTLRSSQVGNVAHAQRSRWSHRRRMQLALDLLVDPLFDALLSGSSHFVDLPETMHRLASSHAGELCHVVHYG